LFHFFFFVHEEHADNSSNSVADGIKFFFCMRFGFYVLRTIALNLFSWLLCLLYGIDFVKPVAY